MDRARTVTWSERARASRGPADDFVLPSRADAVSLLTSALDSRGGPVVVTGEAGVGKSWVCRRVRERLPGCWRWAAIDLSPAIDAGGCLRLILHALGHDTAGAPADSRAAVRDVLAESAEDGRPWGLLVEEAHNASAAVLEELRVLGNRPGDGDHIAGMVLVGQNALARRLPTRPFAALQARLSARVHLRPIDVEELRTWVARLEPGRAWDDETVERLHRETAGNPRRVLAVAGRRSLQEATVTEPGLRPAPAHRSVTVARPEPATAARIPDYEAPPVVPARPPLRLGEGMIEVGWEPAANPPSEPTSPPGPLTRGFSQASADTSQGDGPVTTEVIDDHYAALQAWTEWAQNPGREPVEGTAAGDDEAAALSLGFSNRLASQDDLAERLSGLAGVRAEGQHEFAPFSQLFSKTRQPRDSQ